MLILLFLPVYLPPLDLLLLLLLLLFLLLLLHLLHLLLLNLLLLLLAILADLLNLAVTDLATLLLALPSELYLMWRQYPWTFGEVVYTPVLVLILYCSILFSHLYSTKPAYPGLFYKHLRN